MTRTAECRASWARAAVLAAGPPRSCGLRRSGLLHSSRLLSGVTLPERAPFRMVPSANGVASLPDEAVVTAGLDGQHQPAIILHGLVVLRPVWMILAANRFVHPAQFGQRLFAVD